MRLLVPWWISDPKTISVVRMYGVAMFTVGLGIGLVIGAHA